MFDAALYKHLQPGNISHIEIWMASTARTPRDKPRTPFHTFALEVLFILSLIGLFIPQASF